jgi:hypothetical protein
VPPPLAPGDSATLTGNFGACAEIELEVTYENRLAQTCSYDGTADSSGNVTWVVNLGHTGGDTSCTLTQAAPAAASTIDFEATL